MEQDIERKRLIDKKRNSGGWADIGDIEDGAITEMINIGDRLITLPHVSMELP